MGPSGWRGSWGSIARGWRNDYHGREAAEGGRHDPGREGERGGAGDGGVGLSALAVDEAVGAGTSSVTCRDRGAVLATRRGDDVW